MTKATDDAIEIAQKQLAKAKEVNPGASRASVGLNVWVVEELLRAAKENADD